jgi:hypothetical protein
LSSIQNKTSKIAVSKSLFQIKWGVRKFLVWSSNFEPELQAKYPDIRAYAGVGITDPTASLNFSLSSQGMQTMILRAESGSEFIEASQEDFFIRSFFF